MPFTFSSCGAGAREREMPGGRVGGPVGGPVGGALGARACRLAAPRANLRLLPAGPRHAHAGAQHPPLPPHPTAAAAAKAGAAPAHLQHREERRVHAARQADHVAVA